VLRPLGAVGQLSCWCVLLTLQSRSPVGRPCCDAECDHIITGHLRAILHAFLQGSTVGRPSRSQSKTRNTESPRTDSIITTFFLVHPIPFLTSLQLPSLLLVIADMQARGNGASKTRPPFHPTQFTSLAVVFLLCLSLTVHPFSVTPIPTRAHHRAHRNKI